MTGRWWSRGEIESGCKIRDLGGNGCFELGEIRGGRRIERRGGRTSILESGQQKIGVERVGKVICLQMESLRAA